MNPVDPSTHSHGADETHAFTAFFETRHAADAAKAALVEMGFSVNAVRITDGRGSVTGDAAAAPREGPGLVETLKNVVLQEAGRGADQGEQGERPGFVLTAHVARDRAADARAVLVRDGRLVEDYE